MIKTEFTGEEHTKLAMGSEEKFEKFLSHLREKYVVDNPDLDKELYQETLDKEFKDSLLNSTEEDEYEEPKIKCPTCGSTNIERISAGKKLVGSTLFGIFSKDARSTFHCKNCNYKW